MNLIEQPLYAGQAHVPGRALGIGPNAFGEVVAWIDMDQDDESLVVAWIDMDQDDESLVVAYPWDPPDAEVADRFRFLGSIRDAPYGVDAPGTAYVVWAGSP